MLHRDMLPVMVLIAIFIALAYDIAANNGAWTNYAQHVLHDAWRDLRHLIHI